LASRSVASRPVVRSFASVQVNVDALGHNIVGDAANEPSIAVSPINTREPRRGATRPSPDGPVAGPRLRADRLADATRS
jgi:hypothetical protein